MLKFFYKLSTLALSFLYASAILSADIKSSPIPNWVENESPSFDHQIPENQIQDGIYYLLVDSQTRVKQDNSVVRFKRFITQITNPTGVEESSQIDIRYDPNYQQMQIHTIQVWRNGKPIDKFSNARSTVLQQEDELENLIYNGDETANFALNDIRVGDILDYSYSIIGHNPVYDGIFSQSNYFQWTVPVKKRSVKMLWFKDKPLKIKQHHNNYEIQQISLINGIKYSITQENTQPLRSDKNAPDWFNKYPLIEFSESQTWQEIIDWSIPLFSNASSNAASIREVASRIKSQNDSKSDQLLAALHYVQQEIRYLGIEIGENSHRPTVAHETLQRRYGDCKDKTVLLISILKQLKIEAYPALVNTDLGDELLNRLPKPGAFDHVIVKAILGEKVYWLDPTRQYQNKNLATVFQPDYDQALVVSSDSSTLEAPIISHTKTSLSTVDNFTLQKDYQQPVKFTSTSKMSGLNAENNRRSVATKGLSLLRTNYQDFYKNYYADLNPIEALTFSDIKSNERESSESYSIDNFWKKNEKKGRYNAWFYANTISSYLSRKKSKNREDPLAISFPENIKHVINIQFEEDDWGLEGESLVESNEFFDYSRTVSFDKEKNYLSLTFTYRSKVPHVTSDKLLAYDTALEKLDDDTTYGIYRNIVIQNVTNATEEAVLSDYEENILLIVLFYSIILIISIMLWRIDSNQNPYRGEMILYPVSIVKYFILSMLTFGIYGSYWIYKNFKYIKIQKNESMMPIARGFFDYFWFYPLFSRLVEDSHERFNKNLLPHELIGALLAIVYFLVVFAENLSDYLILALVTSIWVSLPLVIYVNRVNQDNKGAISHNSKWSSRHWLLGFCAIPLIALSMGSTLRVLPANVVIPGNELLSYDLQFMQRKGVIEPGDQINYFYSDAILFIRKDGSGFTKNYVFSYWEDETDGFQLERASYADIKDMEITWAKTSMENTIVKIILSDESYFLLFASSEEKKDKIFVKTLKSLWTAANKSLNQS